MAKIKQAIKWLNEGREICRHYWDCNPKYILSSNGIILDNELNVAQISVDCLEADDWEIYRKKKKWNACSKLLVDASGCYLSEISLEILRLKILEDFENILEEDIDSAGLRKVIKIINDRFGLGS